jgi:prepilin signal peptidase PulO-like enzyme (type II secretory pathway)
MDILFAILSGLLCATLVNYLSDVLPVRRKLAAPTCAACEAPFQAFNYLSLATCHVCGTQRAIRTYVVLISGILIAFILWMWPPAMGFWLALVILTYFGVVTVIDIEHRLILHMVSLAGAVLFVPIGIFLHGWQSTLIGGLVGGGVMLVFYFAGTLFAKYRAKKLGTDDDEEALGFGDVTISAVLGLLVGFPNVVLTLLLGILLGGLVSLLMIVGLTLLRRYDPMNVFTAYGPFLIAGATLMLFFRETVLKMLFGG